MNTPIIILILIVICLCINGFFDIKEPLAQQVNELYDLLQLITCELDKQNIEYTMSGGTLLGAVRHGGLIPWDDDADLCVLNKTPKEVINLMKPLEKFNIIAYETIKGNIVVVKYKNSDISVDLFMMKKSKNLTDNQETYKYLFPYNIQYPNEWFYEHELYPLRNYKFGPLIIKGPNDYENFLNRAYKNWQTTADKWNHQSYGHEVVHTTEFYPKLPDHQFIIKKCNL